MTKEKNSQKSAKIKKSKLKSIGTKKKSKRKVRSKSPIKKKPTSKVVTKKRTKKTITKVSSVSKKKVVKKAKTKKNTPNKNAKKKTVVRKKSISKRRNVKKDKISLGGSNKMKTSSFMYLIAGIFELVMAIPVLGWSIGTSSFGVMWVVGVAINVGVIAFLIKRKRPIYANIIAILANAIVIFTNILPAVPIFGWLLHLVATILLFTLFVKEEQR